jgi:hypothetical protein
MFTIPRINVIESDDGFSVEVLGRTGIRYVDRGKSMKIDSEVLAGPSGLVLNTPSIKKWDDGEGVDDASRQRIVENIRAAFRFRGLEIVVL